MIAQALCVMHLNEMEFRSGEGDPCWLGLKLFAAKNDQMLRKTLFILKRSDGLRDFAVFNSEYDYFRDEDRKYVFKIISVPIVLRDQDRMVHLMSRQDIKLAAVALVERLGK